MYAMTHIAIHDALNAISRRSEPYAYDARARPDASPDAAVAAAAHDVLVPVSASSSRWPPECIEDAIDSVEADYAAALAGIRDGKAKDRGVAVGRAAATAILELRRGRPRAGHGGHPAYVRAPTQASTASRPIHRSRSPRVRRAHAVRAAGRLAVPPGPASSRDRQPRTPPTSTRSSGSAATSSPRRAPVPRTRREIALFWVESSPLQWNRIARTVAASARLDAWEQARLFGLLNMALTDGYTGTFETKYLYKYWRPVTAIRLAATDGKPDTAADPTWTPLRETPPIPDYDSGHSVEGGAAAAVLRRYFGGTGRFASCSTTLPEGSQCGQAGADRARVLELLPGGGGERALAHPRRVPLPRGRRGRIVHGARIGARAVDRFMEPVHHGHGHGGHH